MTIMFLICCVIVIPCIFVIRNLLLKNEKYEETIEEYEKVIINFQTHYDQFREAIEYSDVKIKQADHRGTFKSDDEIGHFFKLIQDLQTLLNSFDYSKPVFQKEEVPKQES